MLKHIGSEVEANEPLCIIHAASRLQAEQAAQDLIRAVEVNKRQVPSPPLVLASY